MAPVKLVSDSFSFKKPTIPSECFNVSMYLNHYNVRYLMKRDEDRTLYLLDHCLFLESHPVDGTNSSCSIIQEAGGNLLYSCTHESCVDKTWDSVRKVISKDDPVIQFFNRKETKYDRRGEGRPLSQILNEPDSEDRWLVKPVFSRGDKGYVVSTYKMGKTLFLTQLGLCLSMGIPFLGFEIPQPTKVLYIRFELKDHRFRNRLQVMTKALGGVEKIKVEPIFELARGFNILDRKEFDWLMGLIEKHRAEVLMLDPLYKVANVDLKDTVNAMPLIRKFDSIIETYPDLLLITAHHLRKESSQGGDKNSWDSTYGPMFFFADMDFEIRLRANHRKDPEFTFEHISNDVPVDSFTFRRDPETLVYYVCNPEADHRDEILAYIGSSKPIKGTLVDWMMSHLGFSRRQAQKGIEQLLEQGLITIDKGTETRGHLVLTEQPGKLIQPI